MRLGLMLIILIALQISCIHESSIAIPSGIVNDRQSFSFLDQDHPLNSSVGSITNDEIEGTGFLISEGIVATNYHVSMPCSYDRCNLKFKQLYPMHLLRRRLYPDVAMFKVDHLPESFIPLELDLADHVSSGKNIAIVQNIASPSGERLSFDQGNIQNIRDEKIWQDLEYAINTVPGSSGSPILNESGKVIAIHKEHKKNDNINSGTLLNSIDSFFSGNSTAEAFHLITILEKYGDSRAKYDLAEIIFEIKLSSEKDYQLILAIIRNSAKFEELKFYLQKIRKLDLPI